MKISIVTTNRNLSLQESLNIKRTSENLKLGLEKMFYVVDIFNDLGEALREDDKYNFTIVCNAKDAKEFADSGREYVFYLHNLKACEIGSTSYLESKYAIENSIFSIFPSYDWFFVFEELKEKCIYLSNSIPADYKLFNFSRPKINLKDIKLVCVGQNNEQGEDELNFILCNEFANKFSLSITFLSYGCEFFGNVLNKYNFFNSNSKCNIACDSWDIEEAIMNHDILLDFRPKDLLSPTYEMLEFMSGGMPTISSNIKNLHDYKGAISSAEANIPSITSALQKIIEDWEGYVRSTRDFSKRRSSFDIAKVLDRVLRQLKNG